MRKAKWIWIDESADADRYAVFFDSFNYVKGQDVSVSISCDSNYTLYVNGVLAAFGQYADYPHYKVYDEVDLSGFAAQGKNDVKIIVWYYGSTSQVYFKGEPGLIFEIVSGEEVLCFSGSSTLCGVDTGYISGRKKLITGQLGFSFAYDTNFKETTLKRAVYARLSCDLIPRPVKKLELTETFFGRCIDASKHLYDLGAERAGLLHIKFKAEKGAVINVAFGEHLADGCVRRRIGNRDFSVELIANGETVEYLNPFRRLGARYLQVSAETDLEIEFIGVKETLYPLSVVPFDAGSPLRQRIYDTSVRTLHLCMHEHYEDTPWREQALYALDSRNQMLCGYYAFKELDFARASLKLMSMDRRGDNLLSICFPSSGELTIPSFSLFFIVQVKEFLVYGGDKEFVGTLYEKLSAIISVFISRLENGLVSTFHGSEYHWNFYEWADGLDGRLWQKDEKRFDSVLNSLFSYALEAMGFIAATLRKDGDAEYFASLRADINKSIASRFFDAEAGLFRTFETGAHFCELGNALAILCGAADKARSERISDILIKDNNLVKTTLSMKGFKYDALIKADREKYKPFILTDIDETYASMLSRGATSFWETIKGESDFEGAGSLCHGWSAIPVYYYNILLKN